MEKKKILLDIDNCLSDSDRRREYILGNIGIICNQPDPKMILENYREALKYHKEELKIGGVSPVTLGKFFANIYKTPNVREQIEQMMNEIPHEKFIIPGTREALSQLSKKFLLGIQSDGEKEY
jgi:hypothetical protein